MLVKVGVGMCLIHADAVRRVPTTSVVVGESVEEFEVLVGVPRWGKVSNGSLARAYTCRWLQMLVKVCVARYIA